MVGSALSQSLADDGSVDYDSLRQVLEDVAYKDQKVRRVLFDSVGLNSPNTAAYLEVMKSVDSVNLKCVVAILEKYGWIARSKVSERATDALFFVIQHSDLETMERWMPKFEKQVHAGEASGTQFALMKDRFLMWQGKRQLYGTQASSRLRADKQLAIWPIEDVKHVNERRRKIGIENIVEEYATSLGALYDPNEKLPATPN